MKRSNNSHVFRIMMLISAFMLMMLLCGCRTRITNNTEVEPVIHDESGMLQEEYQQRRDELGISVAEAPFVNSEASDDEDYDEEYEEYEEFDEEEEEEDEEFDEDEEYDEEDEESSTVRRNTSYPSSVIRRPSPSPIRQPSTTQTTIIRVTLDPNGKGAKCSQSSIALRKGSVYGTLPTPTRSGYDFEGWYTAKTKGSKITSKSKVTKDKDHTLYAHWKETVKKQYTITFDGNGEEDEVTLSSSEMTVEEGGTYGDMPSAKREKYNFSGWFTDPEEGSQVTKGTKFTEKEDKTLYAHWEYDPYKWWNDEYKEAANDIDEETEMSYLIEDNNDKAESFLKDCRTRVADEDDTPEFIIRFIKNFSDEKAAEEAVNVYNAHSETAADAKVIIVTNNALYGSKEEKLFYKMMLLDILYDREYNMDEAEFDLLGDDTKAAYPYVYDPE